MKWQIAKLAAKTMDVDVNAGTAIGWSVICVKPRKAIFVLMAI